MRRHRRRGLVLGAGGPVGAAWTIGALCALEEARGIDLRTCDVLIGTSAGSVLAALIGAGARPADLRDHQLGIPGAGGPLADVAFDYSSTGGTAPPLPRPKPGSLALLARWLRNPSAHSPLVPLSALAPTGRATLTSLHEVIAAVCSVDGWSAHPGLHVVAMDYGTAARAVFSGADDGGLQARLADAVLASCAVPGWFAPVDIAGRRYVDGGVLSSTHADLCAGLGLDEVYVLAPAASVELDEPVTAAARWERHLRRLMTRQLLDEVAVLRQTGTRPVLLTPGQEDLAVMGANLMDTNRRVPVMQTSLRTSADALATVRGARATRV